MSYIVKRNNLKIEAYEVCPCGSGKKFKFCCYPRTKGPIKYVSKAEYPDGRINNVANISWNESQFEICYGFDQEKCSEEVINAHSIQDNRILNRIYEDYHVCYLKPTVKNRGNAAEFEKISHLKASTFFGFCDFHDTEIFEPIEKKEYTGEEIQNFLFAFRAFALEYHNKQRTLRNIQNLFKKSPKQILNKKIINVYRVTCLDVEDYKEIYNNFKSNFLMKNFNVLHTSYRQLDFEIQFATCSAFAIYKDINGNEIINKYRTQDKKTSLVYLNIYPIEGKTNIIFSYQSTDEVVYKEYFNQIENLENLEYMDYLNYIIIEMTENIFFTPSMIKNLPEKEKYSILKSFMTIFKPDDIKELVKKGEYFNFNIFNYVK